MASYHIEITHTARKRFQLLSSAVKPRVAEVITGLASAPRPAGCKKLKGGGAWATRVGDYRVIYTIDDDAQRVTVLWVDPRGEAYKRN
jgi:mRNA interferase RelE/StbE